MSDKRQKYRLEPVTMNEDWDQFVEQSSYGTVYCSSAYLQALDIPHQAYFCYKANERMAALLLLLSEDRQHVVHHGLVVHDGIIYRDFPQLNQAQQHSEQFAIQTFMGETLAEQYHTITLTLSPKITDVRALLWVNYHNHDAQFIPAIRYTSLIDITDFNGEITLNDNRLYQQASVARRQEIRYARKKSVSVCTSNNVTLLVDLYAKTMDRQAISMTEDTTQLIYRLVKRMLATHQAVMFQATTANNDVGSMSVFLLDGNTAHFLFGANDPLFRNEHTGTAVLWEAFYQLAKVGITDVNLEGINSPQRGWFKLSFGGTVVPYYQLTLQRN